MRIVFMGTPDLAATVLSALVGRHEVVGVYTRPDAVRGRGKKLVASPVKVLAEKEGIPVFTPRSFADPAEVEALRALEPDVICVSAYGVILPAAVLGVPRHGCLNVHTSLLPRWRGAAPVQRAILANDQFTGVCIMKMEEGLDTGPYCVCEQVPVGGANAAELTATLAELGAGALLRALAQVESGTVAWTPQGEDGMVYADKIAKAELNCGPDDTAAGVVLKARASTDAHPCKAQVAGKALAIERASLACDDQARELGAGMLPGDVRFSAKRLLVAASDGLVQLDQVKPDGKKSMEARAFAGGIQGIKTQTLTWGRL